MIILVGRPCKTTVVSADSRTAKASAGDQYLGASRPSTRVQNIAASQASKSTMAETQPPIYLSSAPQSHQQIAQHALQLQPSIGSNKRHGAYGAVTRATRISPEDSSSSEGAKTPGMTALDISPAIVHSNGYIESQHPVLPADVQVSTS